MRSRARHQSHRAPRPPRPFPGLPAHIDVVLTTEMGAITIALAKTETARPSPRKKLPALCRWKKRFDGTVF